MEDEISESTASPVPTPMPRAAEPVTPDEDHSIKISSHTYQTVVKFAKEQRRSRKVIVDMAVELYKSALNKHSQPTAR